MFVACFADDNIFVDEIISLVSFYSYLYSASCSVNVEICVAILTFCNKSLKMFSH